MESHQRKKNASFAEQSIMQFILEAAVMCKLVLFVYDDEFFKLMAYCYSR